MSAALSQAERGYVLVTVLWMTALVSLLAVQASASARVERLVTGNRVAAARVELAADAGIAAAGAALAAGLPLAAYPRAFTLEGARIELAVEDEAGKLNPNFASDAMRDALFQALLREPGAARTLSARLGDWIDSDDATRAGGAEEPEYLAAGLGYGPPNARLESLDELTLVLGIDARLARALRPHLTLFTAVRSPDPRRATPLVAQALGAVSAIERGALYGLGPVPAPDVLRVEAVAHAADASFARSAVLARTPDGRGYRIVEWTRAEEGR